MAYHLKSGSTVEKNIHRLLDEELRIAQDHLDSSFIQNPAHTLHTVRKQLKKSRSLLRLVRKSLEKNVYKRENENLRDIGRSLASARNGEVYQETLESLLDKNSEILDVQAFESLQKELLDSHQRALRSLIDAPKPIASAVLSLKKSRTRLQELELEKSGWEVICKNLKRNYRQGKERFFVAYEDRSDRAFHEWRKRVKDLWYDYCLLQPIWSPIMSAFAAEVHQLSQYLGDDHDIAELRNFMLHNSDFEVQESQLAILLPLMSDRQHELRQKAKPLGHLLYAEKPDAFVERMGNYWHTCFSTE